MSAMAAMTVVLEHSRPATMAEQADEIQRLRDQAGMLEEDKAQEVQRLQEAHDAREVCLQEVSKLCTVLGRNQMSDTLGARPRGERVLVRLASCVNFLADDTVRVRLIWLCKPTYSPDVSLCLAAAWDS